jgi:hypothetical protein
LGEGNISPHFIYDYGLYASTQSAEDPTLGMVSIDDMLGMLQQLGVVPSMG